MKYKNNSDMEFVSIGENELTVFDPETGDTHFFDTTGSVILEALESPMSLDELLSQLSCMYKAEPGEIESDLNTFLSELVEKGVVVYE